MLPWTRTQLTLRERTVARVGATIPPRGRSPSRGFEGALVGTTEGRIELTTERTTEGRIERTAEGTIERRTERPTERTSVGAVAGSGYGVPRRDGGGRFRTAPGNRH